MLLLASSIAGGTPVSLNDTLPGIDSRNASLTVRAVTPCRRASISISRNGHKASKRLVQRSTSSRGAHHTISDAWPSMTFTA